MDIEKIKQLLNEAKVPSTDPSFYPRIFTLLARERKAEFAKDPNSFSRVCSEEYDNLSRRVEKTPIQESVSVRNVLKTRRIANLLINDKGELVLGNVQKLMTQMNHCLYSIGPNRQFDAKRDLHILKVLKQLHESKELQRYLKSVSRPHAHKFADQIIRDTLLLPANLILTDAHARRAALSAWMCYLRQSVGSCFGTAPAIIIHDEQPVQFLKDIIELLGTGRLKRTFGGKEYSVPLSTTWGIGDLGKAFPVNRKTGAEDIALSPGILSALEAGGVVDGNLPVKDRIEKVREIIHETLKHWPGDETFLLTSNQLIRTVLLNHFNITEKDVYDVEHRPKGIFHDGLLLQTSHQPAMGSVSKGQGVAQFLESFEPAKNAFKGLADNALLKSWEFTLASFAENKAGFTAWNLYSSLGFGPNEKGGIGHSMYEIIKQKLDEANAKVQDFQYEYEQAYNQVKYLETRLRTASTESEIQWMKVEYQAKANEFYFLQEMRDKLHAKAGRFANLFNLLVDIYMYMFPEYFQEVYDADMHDVSGGPYDDSPAGFRLLYKHGRGNTAQWTRIYSPDEFIESLAGFFTATESEIRNSADLAGIEDEFTDIVTAIVRQVRSSEFLETAFYRMAAAHNTPVPKNPLQHLDQIEKKPWAYISGGTMNTLVSTYYRREQKPTSVERWVESPVELLTFFADTMKHSSPKIMDEFSANPNKSMLMHSPTHAFLLKPGYPKFKETWQNEAFTYTWVRDQMIKPMERFIDNLMLTPEMMQYLAEELAQEISEDHRFYYRKIFGQFYGTMSPKDFREYMIDKMEMEPGLRVRGRPILSPEEIDSKLYTLLPLFPIGELKERIVNIFKSLPEAKGLMKEPFDQVLEEIIESSRGSLVNAKQLQDLCKAMIALLEGTTTTPVDFHRAVSAAAQKLGYALPPPILFADSNWVKDEFGFVVNPGSGSFELWRLDPNGSSGFPLSSWKNYLNGSRQDLKWGIYAQPYEYS